MMCTRMILVCACFMIVSVSANHRGRAKMNRSRKSMDFLKLPLNLLKNFGFKLNAPYRRFSFGDSNRRRRRINFNRVKPGTQQYFDDGDIKGSAYKSSDDSGSGVAFASSSGNGGFAMAGSWSSGNIMFGGNKNKDQIFAGSGLPFFPK